MRGQFTDCIDLLRVDGKAFLIREFHLSVCLPGGIKSSTVTIAENDLLDELSDMDVFKAVRVTMHHKIVAYRPRKQLLGHQSGINISEELQSMYLLSNPKPTLKSL